MAVDFDTINQVLGQLRQRLLESRIQAGHWVGELSSSALSTATAAFALSLYAADREKRGRGDELAERCRHLSLQGLRWLVRHQNADGGWGDTVDSLSNISTTALCWAALSVGGPEVQAAVLTGEGWLRRAAGDLGPGALARAIGDRYGKDRTFSVPILTMCALAGRLGEEASAWRRVAQLPFELAACPHAWFRWLRLPVVSYALPALIAMGRVRHERCPTRNPLVRLVRGLVRERTLRVLDAIQPPNGGFLEATPLTSFVVMSMVGSGQCEHPVVARGVRFLVDSARTDGSWPIDTNLATWCTTLAVNALAGDPQFARILGEQERLRICDWLLGQQYRREHPYTHAAPGGWAWTDLPGGVPDADDTAGALVALGHLGLINARVLEGAAAGVRWLLDLQNSDGGMPTFCSGWGTLPFDCSAPDLTAHAIAAWLAWRDHLEPSLARRTGRAIDRAVRYLADAQRADGAWVPLWFGNQYAAHEENPVYGTARVLLALCNPKLEGRGTAGMKARAIRWLMDVQRKDGGWGGDAGGPASIEETAVAVQALAAAVRQGDWGAGVGSEALEAVRAAVGGGVAWLVERTDGGRRLEPAPIGLYFAKLWYFETLYPLIFATGAFAQVSEIPSHQPTNIG